MIDAIDEVAELTRCAMSLSSGRLRVQPEDFQVEELLASSTLRDGEFIWMQVRKRNLNTRWVALGLARHFGVAGRDVSWAGLKDRRAVTMQWFSVKAKLLPLRPWFEPGTALLAHARSRTRLTPGDHQGNRFAIRIREVSDRQGTERALQVLCARGSVPNYAGPQRFGRDAGNIAALHAWSRNEIRPKDRFERGLWLSAGRSWLFNLALSERVRAGDWHTIVAGDWVVAGSAEGPLWGDGRALVQGESCRRAQDAWQGIAWLPRFLAQQDLNHDTRPWQLRVSALQWQWQGAADVVVEFELPPGGYATTVLREVIHVLDASPTRAQTDREIAGRDKVDHENVDHENDNHENPLDDAV